LDAFCRDDIGEIKNGSAVIDMKSLNANNGANMLNEKSAVHNWKQVFMIKLWRNIEIYIGKGYSI
jgi:hypothetical protein